DTEGQCLDPVMSRRGGLTWEEVIQLRTQLCAALQHAHEKGIIHRDLKPSNLMVLPDRTIKLTDFGIAKDTDVTALTAANCTVGTAAYMSPEQCRGDRDLTYRSDLYSLGVLFYELLTGRKPFIAETPMDMFLLHLQAQCERPSRRRSGSTPSSASCWRRSRSSGRATPPWSSGPSRTCWKRSRPCRAPASPPSAAAGPTARAGKANPARKTCAPHAPSSRPSP